MAIKKKAAPADPQLSKIDQLADLMSRHALAELEFENKEIKVRLRRGGTEGGTHHAHHAPLPVVSVVAAADESTLVSVSSPFVGTFYRAPKPGTPPFIEVGQTVRRGQTLCIVEAMKLMNELESEVDGTVVEILARDAQPVEYGQVLFRVRP